MLHPRYTPFKTLLACLLLLLTATWAIAQRPAKPTAADLHQAIKKLNVLGSVLYVAAHPDDENQRFISYCANYKLFDVNYLSLTRGDGGQNLIGPELRELLGVLRTEELLMARSVDGGKQRFTRANDFGFSKNPEETLRIWDKQAVLADLVWTIRVTQPDVIVNRFFHEKKYDTHGHHTASAMLAVEAFDLAGRADAFPEQLKYVSVWQPRRQFYNLSYWYFGRANFEKMDKSQWFFFDGGTYLPLKGRSNSEVADEARSMHRCQGFGSMSTRGTNKEWFDFIKGDRPTQQDDIFQGINTTWSRVEGGEKIGKLLAKVDAEYRSDNPAAAVPNLLKALEMIEKLPESHWKTLKAAEVKEVIRGCLGLYLEATAAEPLAAPGDAVNVHLEAINRTQLKVTLVGLSIAPTVADTTLNTPLDNNRTFSLDRKVTIPADAGFTAPYWLQTPSSSGLYTVEDQQLRGLPETPRLVRVHWRVTVNGVALDYTSDVAYKVEEPALGEVWRPFEVLPPAFVEFDEASYLFDSQEKKVSVRVKAGRDNVDGLVRLETPAGWSASAPQAVKLPRKGEEKLLTFNVTAPAQTGTDATLTASIEVNGRRYQMRLIPIKYEHIPQQSVLQPAQAKAARIALACTAKNVGYLMGAGDDVPAALRRMGCTVTLLEDKDLTVDNLKKFDAVVVGIRAYNTRQSLALRNTDLFEYVRQGGTLVEQYNNNYDYTTEKVSPLSLKLSRTRVTDEESEMRFLLPEHPVLNTPNKLTDKDFEGWVQERGLYFPSEWDAAFAAPLSCNDPGEKAADGALLIAPYGEGKFIYTGLSFFRELPAGVPGAYRLLANLISQ